MRDAPSPSKDVADLLEALAARLRTDPRFAAAEAEARQSGNVTVYAAATETPAIGEADLLATDTHVTLTMEALNVDPAQVHVTVADDTLWIGLGEGPGALKRDFTLPHVVDEERAVATFRNGVLDVVLPLKTSPNVSEP